MKLRQLLPSDIEKIREIHEKYYPQFDFPDFLNKMLVNFVIENDKNELILAGTVRPIAEALLVTDASKSRIEIGRALVKAQQISMVACEKFGIDELHAFVDNPNYARHLIRHGFSDRSRALSIKVF